jgi:hypothetical protein
MKKEIKANTQKRMGKQNANVESKAKVPEYE